MKKRSNYLFTLAVPLVGAAFALAWLLGFSGRSESGYAYDTVPVAKGSIRKIVSTSGPVRALVTVSVGSQLSGQIETVPVDFNSTVKPGDLLATLDAKTFMARVAQAKADYAVAVAALNNQEAALLKSESILKLADRTVDRQKALSEKGFASTATLDAAVRDAEVAKADIVVAKAQIESAKATIEQRQAALDQAKIDLERTEIRAPVEGTVISRTVDPGQTVAASLQAPELFKIAQDLSRIRIEAQVNEADVGSVAEGNPVSFTVDAYPDRRFTGRVTQVRLAATELNSVVTYTVIIEAANDDRRLFPGMTANVEIEAARKDDVLRVVNDAFRFKPRTEVDAGPTTSEGSGAGSGDRMERTIERMKAELSLTEPQVAALREGLDALQQQLREASEGRMMGGGPSWDQSAMRQQMKAAIDKSLGPLLDADQKRALERSRQGRETTRSGTLWVLGAGGQPERRHVSLGISDDQFTEIARGDLAEGDAVIVRAREVAH